jgi:hypothetical protein
MRAAKTTTVQYLSLVLALFCMAWTPHVLAAPIQLPGGAGDPTIPGTYYADEPKPGPVPNTKSCHQVERYVDLVNSGKASEVVSLFTDDAIVYEPSGLGIAQGRAQIDEFYSHTIGPMSPHVVPVAFLANGLDCSVGLALKMPIAGRVGYALVSMDAFTLSPDGRFNRMIGFVRPLPQNAAPAKSAPSR